MEVKIVVTKRYSKGIGVLLMRIHVLVPETTSQDGFVMNIHEICC